MTAATHMTKYKVSRTVLGKILNHKRMAVDGQVSAFYERVRKIIIKKECIMNKEEKINEFIKLYDRFVDHYNKVKNKITATSELIIIHDELEKRMVNSRFVKITKEGELKDYTPDSEIHYKLESYYDIKPKVTYAKIFNEISENIINEIRLDRENKYFEDYVKKIARCDENDKSYGKLTNEQNLEEKIHLDAIHSVTEKIISNQYPKLLLKFNKLGSKEKEELRGAILEKVNTKEARQAKHWPNIVKAVHAVVGDKPLSQFKTNNGAANSNLYNNVFKKYNDVPLGTLRDWLDEALNSGRLRQDLLEFKK